MIFHICDAQQHTHSAFKVVWMPAHTAKWQVGVARKGDNTRLTETDRMGNDCADALAKKGAAIHRMPHRERMKVATAERVALRAAIQLGVTTVAANNVPQEFTKPDGTIGTRMLRDSDGLKVFKAPSEKKVKKTEAKQKREAAKQAKANLCTAGNGQKDRATSASFGKKRRRRGLIRTPVRMRPRQEATTGTHTQMTEAEVRIESAKLTAAASAPKQPTMSFMTLGKHELGLTAVTTTASSLSTAKRCFAYDRLVKSKDNKTSKRKELEKDIHSLISQGGKASSVPTAKKHKAKT